ncbi:MAG: response regulator, partial [Gammaproteobacteria bacterium]|nr:response regulator [Gammaproteobacteria bacterium]MCD8525341.1 response regulator [Gammaproteobacteria bacterium]MCD8543127.1 response regulator [Gammaproteobacteria bacterium]
QHMNGHIKVASEVGKGSSFTILIPLELTDESTLSDQERQKHRTLLAKKVPAPIQQTAAPEKKKSLSMEPSVALNEHSPLVLVVEDNLTIQMVTEAILNSEGFRVDIASDGKEALEKFKPDTYLCVYMDMGLPDSQGHEVAKLIREKETALKANTQTPIIALTAHAAVEVKTFCQDAGMQGVFSKPINKEKIDIIWARYGEGKDVTIPELTLLDDMVATCTLYKKADAIDDKDQKDGLPIIDIEGTMIFLHSEAKTNQLFNVLCTQLKEQYLPHFHTLVQQRDYTELRKEIHSLIGSLCYSKAPRLNEATLDFQTAAREMSDSTIEQTYTRVKEAAEGFMAYWDKHQLSAGA